MSNYYARQHYMASILIQVKSLIGTEYFIYIVSLGSLFQFRACEATIIYVIVASQSKLEQHVNWNNVTFNSN